MNGGLTSVTKRLCDNFFLAFMILTIAASILKMQLRIGLPDSYIAILYQQQQ